MLTLKSIIRIVLLSVLLLQFSSCSQQDDSEEIIYETKVLEETENFWQEDELTILGNALGTTFLCKTSDDSLLATVYEIDSIINAFNMELSTYIPSSAISLFNEEELTVDLNKTEYFKYCFELSQKIYEDTEGAFDPTVFSLVSLWGFFKDIDVIPTDDEVDSVLVFTGLEEGRTYTYEDGVLTKLDPRFKLVFNAIAKGQAVDVVAEFLESRGQENYYVEIGGELRVKGVNDREEAWIIGIDIPEESNTGLEGDSHRTLENMIQITDRAMATSGNYRDFYELDGEKYSHTINPKTGKPIRQSILSATVIADNTAIADAFATAFMVIGVEKSLELIKNHPEYNLETYLLYEDNGRISRAYSKGMAAYLLER